MGSWYWIMYKAFLITPIGFGITRFPYVVMYPKMPLATKHLCANHLTVNNPMFQCL